MTRRPRSARSSGSSASLDGVAYRLHDEAAAGHLFRVAAGLDSLVPGESEILGQVRDAYEAAAPGPVLDRVFRQALAVGKRVRSSTAIGESAASVPSAAAALVAQVFGELAGAARAARRRRPRRRARRLESASRGAEIAFVANRTLQTADELARRFGGDAIALDEVPSRLGEVDVVVASTSSPETILRRHRRSRAPPAAALLRRHRRPS